MTEEQEQKRLRIIAWIIFIIGIASIFIPVFPGWIRISAPIVCTLVSAVFWLLTFINVQ